MDQRKSTESKSGTTPSVSTTDEAPKESPKRVDRITLKRIGPDDVTKYYHVIKQSIMDGLRGVENSPATATNIIGALYTGHMTGWVGLATIEGKTQFVGSGIAHIGTNPFSGDKSMFIVSLNATEHVTTGAWRKAFEEIEAYARKKGCRRIEAVTSNKRLLRMASSFGFSEPRKWLSKEL